MAVKTGPGPFVAAITGPPGPLVGGTSLRVTDLLTAGGAAEIQWGTSG